MNFNQIIQEIKAGKKVHWRNKGYECILENDELNIVFDFQGRQENCVTLNEHNFQYYSESEFFVG